LAHYTDFELDLDLTSVKMLNISLEGSLLKKLFSRHTQTCIQPVAVVGQFMWSVNIKQQYTVTILLVTSSSAT